MSLSVCIVGLPNVGKSTLFNALTKKQQAAAENYPFCTIEPNSAVVEVADARLEKLAEIAIREGVHHVNTPEPNAIYRSKHHPHRMAVGMLSTNYALDQNPAAVVYLHHNSMTNHWMVYNKGAIYCNEEGTGLGIALADVIDATIYDQGGMPNNGVRCGVIIRNDGRKGGGDWLNACNESYVPAAITEATFLSNPQHARFLGKEKNAIRYAEAIGHGIVNFLKAR